MLRVQLVKRSSPLPALCRPFQVFHRSYASKKQAREWPMDSRTERHMERFIAMKEEEALSDLRHKVQEARQKLDDLQAIIYRLENVRIDQQPGASEGKSESR
jgi:hypothetical protein